MSIFSRRNRRTTRQYLRRLLEVINGPDGGLSTPEGPCERATASTLLRTLLRGGEYEGSRQTTAESQQTASRLQ